MPSFFYRTCFLLVALCLLLASPFPTYSQNLTGRWKLEGVRLQITYSTKAGALRVSQPRSAYKQTSAAISAEFLSDGTVLMAGNRGTFRQSGNRLSVTINGKTDETTVGIANNQLTVSMPNQVASLNERDRRSTAIMMAQQAQLLDQFPGLRETESVTEVVMSTVYSYQGGGESNQQATTPPPQQYRERIIPAKGKPQITIFSSDNSTRFRLYVNGEPIGQVPVSRITADVPKTKRIYLKVVPEEGEEVEEDVKRLTNTSYTYSLKVKKSKTKLLLEGQEFVGARTVREPIVTPVTTSTSQSTDCAVSVREMEEIKKTMDRADFESEKLKSLHAAIESKGCFKTRQIRELIDLFSFDSEKLPLAKFAYQYVTDKSNYYQLAEAFDFSPSKDELRSFIRSNQ